MNVLIVFAHPEPESFNGALRDIAVKTFASQGHTVSVTDLYAMHFNPVAGREDFTGAPLDPKMFSLSREQTHAFGSGTLAADIQVEHDKLREADILLLQFPMWWFGMPAILKGWVDRVFTRGFAYLPGRKYDTGMFRGKVALLSVTTGTSADTYGADGIDGDILTVLWPVHNGVLRYTGFDVISPFISYMPGSVSAEARTLMLAAYRERLSNLDEAPRLFFHPATDYLANERLKPGVLAKSGIQRNAPRAG